MTLLQKIKYLILGMAAMIILNSFAMPVVASMFQKQITVSTGVSIYVDDVKLNPVDANGKPVEAFLYNGTTYLPVRAIVNAVGEKVFWDAKTHSVYLGSHD